MSEFKGKNEKDLQKLLNEKEEGLKNFRFGISGTKTRNVREGRDLRKDIARLWILRIFVPATITW